MHDVSNAINILDSSKGVDKAICNNGSSNPTKEEAGKCYSGKGTATNYTKLSDLFKEDSTNSAYPGDAAKNMGTYPHTSAKISTDVSALNREQKGVVSSAFAIRC